MLRKLRPLSRRPSHTTVVAYLALFVALGGTAYAAATITGADVVDESLTGADVKGTNGSGSTQGVNGTITGADIAGQKSLSNGQPFVDGSLNTYDIQDRGLRAGDLATDSLTTSELGPNSVSTSELKDGGVTKAKLAAPEAWQNIKPADDSHCNSPDSGGYFFCFNNLGSASSVWGNDADTSNNNAAYYKDPYGVVHLKGSICRTSSGCANSAFSGNETMLYLPLGYQPAKDWRFHTEGSSGEALIVVRANTGTITGQGNVDLAHGNPAGVSLDGIEFRACGEPGSEAC